jgi:acetyl-CoA carboxylase carboxyltransferase component
MGSQPLDPAVLLAWPTAEFGGMGLEGAVNIIYRRELDEVSGADERAALHRRLTDELKRKNTAVEAAARFLHDDVIDPADTRAILLNTLATVPPPPPRPTRKRIIEPM